VPVEDRVLEDTVQPLAAAAQCFGVLLGLCVARALVGRHGGEDSKELRRLHFVNGLVPNRGRYVMLEAGDPLRAMLCT
jgi:hypothetical protein